MLERQTPALQILEADARRRAALLAADQVDLAHWVAEDFLQVHANGMPESRASLLAKIASGGITYQAIEVQDADVAMLAPDVGLVHARVTQTVAIAGAVRALHVRVIAVWVLREGRWQLRSYQGSSIASAL